MPGIIEPQAGKAVFRCKTIELNRLGSRHVGAIAAEPDERWCVRLGCWGAMEESDVAGVVTRSYMQEFSSLFGHVYAILLIFVQYRRRICKNRGNR
ncbi:hypothetical protein D3C86_1701710 [compost metagenome]